jgi:hypothetical protein
MLASRAIISGQPVQYLTVVRSRSYNASALSSPDGFHQGSYEELLRSPQQTVVQPEKSFSILENPWLQSVIYRFDLASQVDRRRIKNLEKYQPMSDGLQATSHSDSAHLPSWR